MLLNLEYAFSPIAIFLIMYGALLLEVISGNKRGEKIAEIMMLIGAVLLLLVIFMYLYPFFEGLK